VVIEVERAISGLGVTRVMDRLALSRGVPKVIRSDNGKEFYGKAMVTRAHERGVQLRLIEPGKPNQNAYIDSFNGRLRDECLNERCFPACCTHAPRLNAAGGNTTRSDRRRRWAG
jgi:putative transposase